MDNLLSIIIFLPTFAAAILFLFLRGEDVTANLNAKILALITTIAVFILSLLVIAQFEPANTNFQFVEEYHWLAGLKYKVGVDGISVLFVMLTTFLMPIVIGACWSVHVRVKEYMIMFLLLETMMLAVFCALDLILFYIVFEAGLIPMFLIIGIWGGKQRVYAAFKFFLYTLFGSIVMLLAMITMWAEVGSTDFEMLLSHNFDSSDRIILGVTITGGLQTILFLAFLTSFAIKLPMWPVHTWLPDAHVQAPTAGSVVLAAILLKMGGYGFLRFNLPMLPVAAHILADFMIILSVTAIIYTSLIALMQKDMKKLIAYSSVAHMGFVTLGIFTFHQQGLDGAVFQMISHGFISSALFIAVGVIYDRIHTRDIDAYGGLVVRMPIYALVFMLFTMANIGLPATSGFIGEFLVLLAIFKVNTFAAIGATSGIILSASYALWLYRRVIFGDLIKHSLQSIKDITAREKIIIAPLVIMTLLLGIYPNLVIDVIAPTLTQILQKTNGVINQFTTVTMPVTGVY